MITQDDLNWWLENASQLDWIWAKTYAATAPHSYVVEGRTAVLSHDDYVRAGRVIHTFGQPAKFYGMTNIYLTSLDGRLKWWTMDRNVNETTLVNQATTERVYGVQNAPVTFSGLETKYDATASTYDELHPTSEVLRGALCEAFEHLTGQYPPSVVDIGCGTGRLLDLGLTKPDRYAGVDPSTPMLNHLVRKHPSVGALYPIRIEDALGRRFFTAGQFEIVTVLGDGIDNISTETLDALRALASRGLIVAVGDGVEVRSTLREPAIAR